MESAAAILKRAVEMDTKEQYTLALVLYQEGVRILLDTMKGIPDASPRVLAPLDKKKIISALSLRLSLRLSRS